MNVTLSGAEPTNAQEAAAKPKSGVKYSEAAYQALKAKLPKEERAWEETLEENLGDAFYLPRHKKAKLEGRSTCWDYVKDIDGLPRVLLIGDSISCGYTLPVREALKGIANIHRAPENCGPTKKALEKLDIWLGNGKWDLIHFNFGIHDRSTSSKDYTKRLEQIVARLKKTGAKLVWANSTPLSPGTFKFKRGMMLSKNKIAATVMKKHGIPIDDLYAVALPLVDKTQRKDGCHFTEEGSLALGKTVAAMIERELKQR